MSWRANVITDPKAIRQIALKARRVAVLGCKTEKQADQPAFFVPKYLQDAGVDVVPVPVFYPDVTRILDRPVLRRVADVPAPPALDVVNVFRRPADVMQHVDDILAARPKVVWLQVGVSSPEAEQAFAQAGIKVVANKCLMVEHRQALAEARDGGREGGGGGESRSML